MKYLIALVIFEDIGIIRVRSMDVLGRIIKEQFLKYQSLRYLLNQEKKSNSQIKLLTKIWCLMHGFSSSKYDLYNLTKKNYKMFLSDFQRYKTKNINGPYSLIINDKSLFNKFYKDFNVTAKIYGKVEKGNIILGEEKSNPLGLIELVKEKNKIIVKKIQGGGGKGIHRLSYYKDSLYLDDEPIKERSLELFIKKLRNHLITEHLTQAKYSNDIYPGTINSIRILTLRDPQTDEVFIPIAVHKFGSEKTKPVDNVWKGGLTALVDLDTGVLGKSAYHLEENNKIEWLPVHPDTNKRIEGTMIPNWEQVKNKVLEVANFEKNLKYVGWDVVVTDSGPKIIEGNNYSDVNILQIHQPLLKNKRVREFYKYYGIVK